MAVSMMRRRCTTRLMPEQRTLCAATCAAIRIQGPPALLAAVQELPQAPQKILPLCNLKAGVSQQTLPVVTGGFSPCVAEKGTWHHIPA